MNGYLLWILEEMAEEQMVLKIYQVPAIQGTIQTIVAVGTPPTTAIGWYAFKL